MDNVRKAINKVLDRATADISPSKEDRFANEFAAFLRERGIDVEDETSDVNMVDTDMEQGDGFEGASATGMFFEFVPIYFSKY